VKNFDLSGYDSLSDSEEVPIKSKLVDFVSQFDPKHMHAGQCGGGMGSKPWYAISGLAGNPHMYTNCNTTKKIAACRKYLCVLASIRTFQGVAGSLSNVHTRMVAHTLNPEY
jgi:hypothetical protein